MKFRDRERIYFGSKFVKVAHLKGSNTSTLDIGSSTFEIVLSARKEMSPPDRTQKHGVVACPPFFLAGSGGQRRTSDVEYRSGSIPPKNKKSSFIHMGIQRSMFAARSSSHRMPPYHESAFRVSREGLTAGVVLFTYNNLLVMIVKVNYQFRIWRKVKGKGLP